MIRPALLALTLTLTATAAWADEAVSTSNGAAAPMPAQDDNAPTEISRGDPTGPARDPSVDRRLHGEAGVAVGSDGYRSAYLALSGRLGERGYAGVAMSTTRGGRAYGPPVGYGDMLRRAAPDCVTVERDDGLGDPTQAQTACAPPAP